MSSWHRPLPDTSCRDIEHSWPIASWMTAIDINILFAEAVLSHCDHISVATRVSISPSLGEIASQEIILNLLIVVGYKNKYSCEFLWGQHLGTTSRGYQSNICPTYAPLFVGDWLHSKLFFIFLMQVKCSSRNNEQDPVRPGISFPSEQRGIEQRAP